MGTPSSIGVLLPDGSVKSIYCHWDGNPAHVGAVLKKHYIDPTKIEQLMDLGDLSSLGPEIGEKHDFDAHVKGVCTAYGRDRGEDNTSCDTHVSISRWVIETDHVKYHYLWNPATSSWEMH